jgi:hypothetical protein
MGRALVLVGHGSARNPHTKDPLLAAAEEIRARGVFDEGTIGVDFKSGFVAVESAPCVAEIEKPLALLQVFLDLLVDHEGHGILDFSTLLLLIDRLPVHDNTIPYVK